MNYQTGETIELGDYVELSGDMTGVIVVVVEDAQYSKSYQKEEWDYLERGLLVLSDQAGLVHVPHVSEEIKLISKDDTL
ncbi:hypothetical protein [Acinetobacter proteolyticus]|uniref:Uncharacterized protein n=1 Tax=Acinetobacter proteolyticus TaxID=1776741 RepID=A0A2N0WEX7_9GAMM|nr:hypothetical protein [Acinetobacter proteolyticus]MBK5649095.1 hypothetical protein [Acinetobacter sp.]PKF33423.1 hypothetical protein CW311_11515 [Acinetobacter proteolyticus]